MTEIELIALRIQKYNNWSNLEILEWTETPNPELGSSPINLVNRKLGYKVFKYLEDCFESNKEL